jgi:tetratricopeptide (TPR) repeat protein
MDNLKGALQEVENLGKKVGLDEIEAIQVQLLRSLIFTQMGDLEACLELEKELNEEFQQLENQLLMIDIIITLATTNFRFDELSKCLDLINNGEKMLRTIDSENEAEIVNRVASLKYLKGKVYWKRGELDKAIDLVQESFSLKQDFGNIYETADYQNLLGIFFIGKGELDKALDYLQKSLRLFEKLDLKSSIIKTMNNVGLIYWKKGNLSEALANYKISLEKSEELQNKQFTAKLSVNIGLIYWNMGELDNALYFYQKGLALSEEIGDKSSTATCFNNIGIIYQFKGELDQALEFYQKSLSLHEELTMKPDIALCLNNIGEIHNIKGDFDLACNYYKKSLILFEEVGDNYNLCIVLYNLVLLTVDHGTIKDSRLYLKRLEEIDIKEENKYISQTFRLAKAIVLKESERVINLAEAQVLLQEIAHEEMISLENNVTANLNLCELLLQELRATGNEEVLRELKKLLSHLQNVAEGQNSFIWLAKTYWLQSKIALLECDIEQSQELLNKAKLITTEKGLIKLLNKISSEREILLSQFNKWEQVLAQKPSVSEIIELTQIEEMVERMIQKKLDSSDEEVMDYAAESRRLVEMWEQQ